MSTIYDIAEKSGYSVSTVSKALNGYPNISQKTKDKVQQIAKELNYIPNASARGLMTKKSFIIGLMIYQDDKEAIIHSHLSEIIVSFKNYVESRGYDVLFVNTSTENNLSYYERCKYRSLDGLFIAMSDYNYYIKKQTNELVASELPIVSVETIYKNRNVILCDSYNGAKKALDYLYFLGHRKIAYIDAESNGDGSTERLRAYKDFLKEKNITLQKNMIYRAKGFKKYDGLKVAKEIFTEGFSNLPTAIFCVCDEVAIGVIEHFKTQNVRVPDDISVIGFDDIKVAEYVGLTTIRQNRSLIGETAGKKLIAEIEGNKETEVIKTKTELIIRDTCRSIK